MGLSGAISIAGRVDCVVFCTTSICGYLETQVHRQSMVEVIKHRQCHRHVPHRQKVMDFRIRDLEMDEMRSLTRFCCGQS